MEQLPCYVTYTTDETREVIRTMVGVRDLNFEILGSTTYDYAHRIADTFPKAA